MTMRPKLPTVVEPLVVSKAGNDVFWVMTRTCDGRLYWFREKTASCAELALAAITSAVLPTVCANALESRRNKMPRTSILNESGRLAM